MWHYLVLLEGRSLEDLAHQKNPGARVQEDQEGRTHFGGIKEIQALLHSERPVKPEALEIAPKERCPVRPGCVCTATDFPSMVDSVIQMP